jgi:ribosomal protein S18 acetylase RimI-like enzyme
MSLKHHPYNGFQDFIIMTSILAVGRKTTNRSYYVHTVDLSWWMFYSDYDDTHWREYIFLWEHADHPCGWSLFDPDWSSFDVFLLPEVRGSKEEIFILDWTIHKITEIIQSLKGKTIRTMWVSEYDHDLIALLRKRNFNQDQSFMWYMEFPLNNHIPDLSLPTDYSVRSIREENEIIRRAVASHNAFGSSQKFEDYWPRYQRFMNSPVYNQNFDLVTESPDGQFASFCIIWPDPVNHLGLFEPVGTHTQFQRKGLGKAVVTAGLHALDSCGMHRAMVCVENDNTAALQLYQEVGFEVKDKLLTYIKYI